MRRASEGAGLMWTFEARDEATVFHTEVSLLATDPDGQRTLWNLGSNLGFVERITIRARHSAIIYAFAWGHPADPLQERSLVTMLAEPTA